MPAPLLRRCARRGVGGGPFLVDLLFDRRHLRVSRQLESDQRKRKWHYLRRMCERIDTPVVAERPDDVAALRRTVGKGKLIPSVIAISSVFAPALQRCDDLWPYLPGAVDVTRAIVRALIIFSEIVCTVSTKTTWPATLADGYPALEAETVYVSGPNVRNPKWPAASVVVVAVCDGLVAVTWLRRSELRFQHRRRSR